MTPHPPIVFLDFDGVLHAFDEPALISDYRLLENSNLFCWRPILEQALEPYPEVRIVVSSGWRLLFDDTNLIRLLGHLAPRFLGVVECRFESRAEEIYTEAKRRGITHWLAIDDHPSVRVARKRDKRFIACVASEGLNSPAVRVELAQKLKGLSRRGKLEEKRPIAAER